MASSSTSLSHDDVYNVFINHRGPEVKEGLASHIYRRLLGHGLKVFLDQPEMQEGEAITPQIKRAIRTAPVHIAIFSEGYAESSWCLDELLDMLDTVKSGSVILPVYYNVQPSHLRWTQEDGVYARALRKLQKKTTLDYVTNKKKPRHDSDTIEKWRKALADVSLISGFDLNDFNSDKGQLVDEVVQRVLEKVPKVHPHEHPTIVPQQPGEVQLGPLHHVIHVGAQQSGAGQLDPQDRIGLDQTISQTERAYSKQRKALCKDSWGLLVLSAIVSGGVLIAFLWKYCEQFLWLRLGRRLIQERHSSRISAVDLEVDDLEINKNYWSWITERAAIVIAFMTLSICLWLSCKSRLSC